MDSVRSGLSRVLADAPYRTGHLDLSAGWSEPTGLMGRLEAGHRLLPNVGLYGYGELSERLGPSVGAGIRVAW